MFIFDRFEALRASKGITKTYIASAINRKSTVCQDWKQKKSEPNMAQIAILSDILNTTPEYLTGETDDPAPAVKEDIPHEKLREVFSEGGIRVLLDATSNISANGLQDVFDKIREKQQENDRS